MNNCCKKGCITAEPLKANIISIGDGKLVIDEDGVTIVNAKIKIK